MPAVLESLRSADRPRERLWALGASALADTGVAGHHAGHWHAAEGRPLDVAGRCSQRGRLAPAPGTRPRGRVAAARGHRPRQGGPAARGLRARAAAGPGGAAAGRADPGAGGRRPHLCAPAARPEVEEFHLLALDTQSQVLREVLVTRGLLNSSLVHPREVFRAAIAEAAAGIIVVHNHPSGDPTPSAEDRAVTRQLVAAGRLLDLPVYDHVIMAGDRWFRCAAGCSSATAAAACPGPAVAILHAGFHPEPAMTVTPRPRQIAGIPGGAGAHARPARSRADRPGAPLQRVRAPGPEADVGRGLRLAQHRRGARSWRSSCSTPPPSPRRCCTTWWRTPTSGSRTSPGSSAPRSPGIVDGLTKISHLTFRSTAEEQVENYRKLLLSIAKDARVIIIKLADRLHNMRTLEHLAAREAAADRHRDPGDLRAAGAPLRHGAASRRSWRTWPSSSSSPRTTATLVGQVAAKRAEREQMIVKLRTPLEYELRRAGIESFEVTGRPKHLWSIFQKMKRRNKAVRRDLRPDGAPGHRAHACRSAITSLGIIHHNWTPLQERIKDYIASPKSNAYQSLHTTIFGPGGQLFEVQIRTQEMHRTAEYGIAAHWLYKTRRQAPTSSTSTSAGSASSSSCSRTPTAPRNSSSSSRSTSTRTRSSSSRPQGDVKRLPKGATPIDFAFHVHTEGRACSARAPRSTAGSRRCTGSSRTATRSRSSPAPAREAEPRLAEPRAHRARPPQDQAVDPARGGDRQPASSGQEILAREVKRRRLERAGRRRGWPGPRRRSSLADAARPRDRDRPGRRGHRPGDAGALSRAARRGAAGAQAHGVRAGHRPDPAGPRHQDPGRGRPDGALRPVLPAGAGRHGGGLRDAGAGHLDPPRRLSQPAHAVGRRPAGGDRLAGDEGESFAVRLEVNGEGPARALRRHHAGGQPDRHQHQGAPTSTPRTARCSGTSSSRWTTCRTWPRS